MKSEPDGTGSSVAHSSRGIRHVLTEQLWPQAPRWPQGWLDLALGAGLLVFVTVASLLRQEGASPLETVWAEDGGIFLEAALRDPLPTNVAQVYAGYLHLYPRLVAEAVAFLPVSSADTAFALAAAATSAVCALLIAVGTAGHLRHRSLRYALGAATVLTAAAGPESLNSIALSQWFLAAAAFVAVLWVPPSRVGAVVVAVVLAVTMLSAPLALVLVPVAGLRLLVLSRLRDRLPGLVALVAAVIQLAVVYVTNAPTTPGGTPAQLSRMFLELTVAPAIVGVSGFEELGSVRSVDIALGVLVVAAVVAAVRRTRPKPLLVLVLVALAAIGFAFPTYSRGEIDTLTINAQEGGPSPLANGSRFCLVPALLLLLVLFLALDEPASRLVAATRWAALALLAVVVAADFHVTNLRSDGPLWDSAVAAATRECRAGATDVLIVPAPGFENFKLEATCAALEPERADDTGSAGVRASPG